MTKTATKTDRFSCTVAELDRGMNAEAAQLEAREASADHAALCAALDPFQWDAPKAAAAALRALQAPLACRIRGAVATS